MFFPALPVAIRKDLRSLAFAEGFAQFNRAELLPWSVVRMDAAVAVRVLSITSNYLALM